VAPLLPALSLLAFAWIGPALADDAQALAQAVRSYYDEGPEAASALLDDIVAQSPQRDDAAWWLARCQIELGQAEAALVSLAGRDGENIPGWHFPALEAHAAAVAGQQERAWQQAHLALELAPASLRGDSLLAETRGIAASLAARRGDDGLALSNLLALEDPQALPLGLRAALPELDRLLALPLASGATLEGPLLLEARGSWWTLPAGGGLARMVDLPPAEVVECEGPDLCDAAGSALLDPPGVRFTPAVALQGVLYGAAHEPLVSDPRSPGLFSWQRGGAPLRLCTSPPGAQDQHPVAGPQGRVFFLRQHLGITRLMRLEPGGSPEALAPDVTAIASVAVVGEQVLLVAVDQGVSSLRALPVDAAADQPSATLLAVPLELWALRSP
jgi:hypothetical protein